MFHSIERTLDHAFGFRPRNEDVAIHDEWAAVKPVFPKDVGEWLAAFEAAAETAIPCGICGLHGCLLVGEDPLAWLLEHMREEMLTVSAVFESLGGEETCDGCHTMFSVSRRGGEGVGA